MPAASSPRVVLNQMMEITRAAGSIGIPGLYVTADSGRGGCRGEGRQPQPPLRESLVEGA